jgi:cbb3-type cytochrome oxidase subunit 1
MGKTLLKISVVYFMLAISLGLYMSFSKTFDLSTVHVHLNLVGWVSLALIGLFYHHYPSLEESSWAKGHFWFHNIGLPVMMISIAIAILGGPEIFFLFATIGGLMVLLGVLFFGFNVLLRLDKN